MPIKMIFILPLGMLNEEVNNAPFIADMITTAKTNPKFEMSNDIFVKGFQITDQFQLGKITKEEYKNQICTLLGAIEVDDFFEKWNASVKVGNIKERIQQLTQFAKENDCEFYLQSYTNQAHLDFFIDNCRRAGIPCSDVNGTMIGPFPLFASCIHHQTRYELIQTVHKHIQQNHLQPYETVLILGDPENIQNPQLKEKAKTENDPFINWCKENAVRFVTHGSKLSLPSTLHFTLDKIKLDTSSLDKTHTSLNLITMDDVANRRDKQSFLAVIDQLRETFSTLFSKHYAYLLVDALKKAHQNNDSISRQEGLQRLGDFSDLIANHFNNDISTFTENEIEEKLKKIYAGGGFEDEVATLLSFNGQLNPETDADLIACMEEYNACLENANRSLKEVNFVAITNNNKIVSFAIYHLFDDKEQNRQVLHIRQAASLFPGQGHLRAIATFLTDQYPEAYYEANQRLANVVPMKDTLVNQGILEEKKAVLGYSAKYKGLVSKRNTANSLFNHHQTSVSNPNPIFTDARFKGEAEFVSTNRFFSHVKFLKDTQRDDLHLHENRTYLRPFKKGS